MQPAALTPKARLPGQHAAPTIRTRPRPRFVYKPTMLRRRKPPWPAKKTGPSTAGFLWLIAGVLATYLVILLVAHAFS